MNNYKVLLYTRTMCTVLRQCEFLIMAGTGSGLYFYLTAGDC